MQQNGNGSLGERIRRYRKKNGQTLKEIAEQSGVTSAYLSLLERDKAQPSINTLFALAKVFDVKIQSFFNEEENMNDVEQEFIVRRRKRPVIHYADGYVDELLTPQHQQKIELLYCHIPVGDWSVQEYSHEGYEAGVVIQGVLELKIKEHIFVLEEGDSFTYSSESPHCYRNAGATECVVLWVNTPCN